MKSGFNIEWTNEALNNLDSVIEYLAVKWTDREIKNFFKKLDRSLNIISKNPFAFPSSNLKLKVRRCVLSKQTTIYYEIKYNAIVILTLFDNRKLPYSIKL